MFKRIIDFKKLSVEEVKRDYHALWFTYRQYFSELNDEQIAIAVSIALDICLRCENTRSVPEPISGRHDVPCPNCMA